MADARVLITGGAGFVGSSLAIHLASLGRFREVVAFDNLYRRGSELSAARVSGHGVTFMHGDIRQRDDLDRVGAFDILIECSAEPSVHAGYGQDPSYVLGTNLHGAVHCLEAARRANAGIIFLSTSRVYPIETLRALPLVAGPTRLTLDGSSSGPGWSVHGISEAFPLAGHRSLYGATKLAAELLLDEYREMYGLPVVINRCGVIAGPWQMGRVDQGFVALWAARHLWGERLAYTGFDGAGLQVRDLLHVADLCELIAEQCAHIEKWSGQTLNIGGGASGSVSLVELTEKCRQQSGRQLIIDRVPTTARADIPYYVSDTREVTNRFGWAPRRSVDDLLEDVFEWLRANQASLRPLFGAGSGAA